MVPPFVEVHFVMHDDAQHTRFLEASGAVSTERATKGVVFDAPHLIILLAGTTGAHQSAATLLAQV